MGGLNIKTCERRTKLKEIQRGRDVQIKVKNGGCEIKIKR